MIDDRGPEWYTEGNMFKSQILMSSNGVRFVDPVRWGTGVTVEKRKAFAAMGSEARVILRKISGCTLPDGRGILFNN